MRILIIVCAVFMLIKAQALAGLQQDTTGFAGNASSETAKGMQDAVQSTAPSLPLELSLPSYLGDSVKGSMVQKVLARNQFVNFSDAPVYRLSEIRELNGKEWLFYLACFLLLILGLFKTFFRSYFNNLFLIFFNTSLRQSQLTDQLSQAKLPSFILNVYFMLSAGTYVWLLFSNFNRLRAVDEWLLLPLTILGITIIYMVKFLLLKFIGWLAGISSVTNVYIFIIFLVNKIMAILLIPFIIMLAFATSEWKSAIATVSALFIGLLFISRYFKSFGALEARLQINIFHLLIFIVAVEILPLLILFKVVVDYLV